MDEISEVKKAIRHENWKRMYEEYQSSKMMVKDWRETQGISVKAFYCRLKVLRENLLKGNETHDIVPIAACENNLTIGKLTQLDDRMPPNYIVI